MKKERRSNTALLVWTIIFAVILLVAFVATMIATQNAFIRNTINSVLGGSERYLKSGDPSVYQYYEADYESKADALRAANALNERIVEEGIILLENDGTLPLAKSSRITVLGKNSADLVLGGSGSNAGSSSTAEADVVGSLETAGFVCNPVTEAFYADDARSGGGRPEEPAMGDVITGFPTGETSSGAYDKSVTDSFDEYNDAAVVIISRIGGEGFDLPRTMFWDGADYLDWDASTVVPGAASADSHYLELDLNEQALLAMACDRFENVVVVFNSASPIETGFLTSGQYPQIKAALWMGAPGVSGISALVKVLKGDVVPSGHTLDTFAADFTADPTWQNFGNNRVKNGNTYKLNGKAVGAYYVEYREGIYNGYKYTETRYEDVLTERAKVGQFDYEAAVTYPFGYGLSYSTFSYKNFQVAENSENDTYTLTVDVTNESDIDGKEVVQAYVQKPYTKKDIENGVEKAAVELVGFTKVDVPANGTVTATIEVEGKYLASYDANVEKTYVIGSEDADDDYLFTVAMDAHDATNNILQYKAKDGMKVDLDAITTNAKRGKGDSSLVWAKHFAYDKTTYSTNAHIEEENEGFQPRYDGEEANYGVDKITNQFDDTDFQKAGLFDAEESSQVYMSRNDWEGTYGHVIQLTASDALAKAQANPGVEKDTIQYPTYDELGFYESTDDFDEIKLIYLRGKDYDDPLWDTLLDRISWDETCIVLQDALRYTKGIDSIAAPMTSQQNGAISPVHSRTDGAIPSQTAFRGFAEEFEDGTDVKPTIFLANGTVAATYNKELIYEVGRQTGEEAAWAGYNGIYGLGVNIHRGAYCGRTFEYYSEDGFLTGVAAGYEASGLHDMGVFVLAKHAVLNDQETRRAGLNVWANEQSIREIYCRALEVAIDLDRKLSVDSEGNRTHMPVLGVMTGMNRLGAKWTGGQGFLNTVLRAEFGMTSYAISDYNSSRPYMNPIQGVLYGNDLPDGNPAGAKGGYDYDGNDIRFQNYETGYGELAWKMRDAIKNVLYTVVNSNAMNGVTGDTSYQTITPLWQKLVPVAQRVTITLLVWAGAAFVLLFVFDLSKRLVEERRLHTGDDK